MAKKIKLDENLTINQVLNLTGRGQKGTLKTNIQKAGLSLDDKFSSLRDSEFLKKLDEVGTEGNFTELTVIENNLRKEFELDDNSGKFPFGDKKTFGEKSKSRLMGLKKADQARKAIKVELPSIKEINQAIHTATQKLVANGNYEAAALLQVKHHSGLRTTEIVNLTTGKPEKGAKYGTLVKGSDTLVQISNKGNRTNFRLSSMPMGVLQYLAEVNGTDDPNKSVRLFRTGQATLEKQINTVVNDVFKQNNLVIRDQDTGLPRKFTVGLLRKNVFSAIDDEFGTGVANRVLGHSTRGDVGLTHYKVERTSRSKLDVNTLAAEQFNSTYLSDIGQSSPQAVMSSYRFSEKFFPVEPVAKLTTPNVVEEAAQKTGLNLETKTAEVSANVDTTIKDTDKKIKRLETQLSKLENLQTQVDDFKNVKTGKNDILPTTTEINDYTDFTQDELDELERGGITSAKKEAEDITSKLSKKGKTLKGVDPFSISLGVGAGVDVLDSMGEVVAEETAASTIGAAMTRTAPKLMQTALGKGLPIAGAGVIFPSTAANVDEVEGFARQDIDRRFGGIDQMDTSQEEQIYADDPRLKGATEMYDPSVLSKRDPSDPLSDEAQYKRFQKKTEEDARSLSGVRGFVTKADNLKQSRRQ